MDLMPRPDSDRRNADERMLPKFMFAVLIQVATGVISVAIGSWLTLQIMGYRVTLLEETSKDQLKRNIDMQDRMTKHETELARLSERNRVMEMLDEHRSATEDGKRR